MTHSFFYKNNRLQQLRGFCFAAKYGSISKAAKYLKLSHASISVQIKSLERDLETMLFKRHGPSIHLTLEGKKLYDLSNHLVEGIDNIPEVFKNEKAEELRSTLRIAANMTTLNFILPRTLEKLFKRNKSIFVDVYHSEHEEVIELLRANKIDLAVMPKRLHKPYPKDLEFKTTHRCVPSLITRKDHPLAGRKLLRIEEISTFDIALPPKELIVIPNLYEIFPDHNISKRMKINFVNWETTKKFIEAGLVISISSDIIIEKNDVLLATPLPHLFDSVEYGYLIQKKKAISENAKFCIEALRSLRM